MTRIILLSLLTLSLLTVAGLPSGRAAEAGPLMTTYVYKQVGSLEIKADVYRPAADNRKRPVVVYIHGGSLINGGREKIGGSSRIRDRLLAANFLFISLDYRLAPETKLPLLVADVEAAFRWVREKGPALFGADPDRIGVAGASAGGYLTLVAGFRVKPRPFALLAESSYGDLLGAWQMRPSIHPPHYSSSHLGEAEAWRQVAGPPVANAADRPGDGGAFNDFIRRQAQWPKAISGWDPKTESDKFLPYLPLRNVTPDYPPTFLIHGHDDSDVPREQPEMMAAELERKGVGHKLVLIAGGEHGYRGGDPAAIEAAQRDAVEFLLKHLPPASGDNAPARTAPH